MNRIAGSLVPVALAAQLAAAGTLEVRFHPDRVFVNEVAPERGLSDVMIHQVAVVNGTELPIGIRAARIDLLAGGAVVQSHFLGAAVLAASAERLHAWSEAGVLKLYDMLFQTSRVLGDATPSPTASLAPGTALILTGRPLLFQGEADRIRVRFEGVDATGRAVTAEGEIPVDRYRSPNRHGFPVRGTWSVVSGANLQDHHRWATMEEFALDLAQIGAGGRVYDGDVGQVARHHAYGREVLATADGVVEAVEGGCEEATGRLPREGESAEEFAARTRAEQAKLVARDYRAPLGNYVTLRHAGGEYTHYAHLAAGSVRVAPGDRVSRGEVIGRVGQTGNSEAPHLHFQVTDGADPMYSRGLPVVFDDVRVEILGYEDRPLQSGWSVTTREGAPARD